MLTENRGYYSIQANHSRFNKKKHTQKNAPHAQTVDFTFGTLLLLVLFLRLSLFYGLFLLNFFQLGWCVREHFD